MLTWQLHLGSALEVLRELPSESVNCVVTSPPYWGLRDYGVEGQFGLEPTPDEYVSALVAVFAEMRRLLRADAVCWLNMGDSYSTQGGRGEARMVELGRPSAGALTPPRARGCAPGTKTADGLKPKDLVMVPARAALALQADGWYLRSDVIWAKPNPMPESVTDRPTKSHEYVFLLTKSARYWYDSDAIREPVTQAMLDQMRQGYDGEGTKDYEGAGVQNPSSVKARIIQRARDKQRGHSRRHAGFNDRWDAMPRAEQLANGANARTVWTIPTEPSPYEHFAVMPRALARKCILAGCPFGGTILDPFAGVATSGVVALEEGRNFVGIELNPKYHAIARERLANVAPLLAQELSA